MIFIQATLNAKALTLLTCSHMGNGKSCCRNIFVNAISSELHRCSCVAHPAVKSSGVWKIAGKFNNRVLRWGQNLMSEFTEVTEHTLTILSAEMYLSISIQLAKLYCSLFTFLNKYLFVYCCFLKQIEINVIFA